MIKIDRSTAISLTKDLCENLDWLENYPQNWTADIGFIVLLLDHLISKQRIESERE